jgi:N-acyl-D-amino-acid deacylase
VRLTLAGGTVVDGTGRDRFRADVTIDSGRIVEVAPHPPGRGRRRHGGDGRAQVVDVSGLVVAPGFIDMHAHSDLALLADPVHEAKVSQGVTLEVVGQDGLGYAPVDDDTIALLRRQLAGWNGDPPGLDWSWRSVGDYLRRIDGGAPVNAALLVPHGTVRLLAMGADDRPATSNELDRMCALVATGMREGAVGMSAGLTYTPGMYAGDDELVALCRVVAEAGGYYCPHHRSYGRDALAAYADQVAIARASGVRLHLAHAVLNFPENAGRADELLALVDDATASGVDISFDTYPYLAGSTYLHALLPSWVQAGGPDATLHRLRDGGVRQRLRHELEVTGTDGNHGLPVDWSVVVVSGVRDPRLRGTVGRSVAEVARASGTAPCDTYLQLLLDDSLGSSCLVHIGDESNIRCIMRHPRHTVGSDAILVGDRPHPRAWGTFPRYLGRYVREEGILALEECVRHMTGAPAARLGLADRGVVAPGYAADLVCFDPATIIDNGTYDEPRVRSSGIEHVLVNGSYVLESGVATGRLAGRAIRSGAGAV